MEYINKRSYASLRFNGLEQKGDRVNLPEATGRKLEERGLVIPAYKTKEDKRAVKFRIEHAGGPWFWVMQGEKKVEKLHKKKAKKLAERLNGVS